MKNAYAFIIIFLLFSCSNKEENTAIDTTSSNYLIKAVDVSFLPLIESEGTIYKNNNVPQDALATLKIAGCNTVRIRLWKNPTVNQSTFNEVKVLAIRAKNAGFKVWLSVHFSDTWADPANQTTPTEWQSLGFTDLKTAAENYTSTILTEINPDIIQIGNEINSGLLWPYGHLINNESQSLQLIEAISSKIRTQKPNTKIMLHYAGIGSEATWFFNKMSTIDYDYIGLSYYPIWHGKSLSDVNATITSLGQAHNKKVIIAETAYPFTLNWNDLTNNIVGQNDQLISTYLASNEGQKDFVLSIKNLVKQNEYGIGFCYWGGEWVAFRGPISNNGSSWENQALWDFDNNALPVMDAFKL
jgi:arabinogalactan endo-1,4-beta-galactosidase